MTAPFPILETPRLILRPPLPEDLPGFIAFAADPETTRYLGGVGAPSEVWRALRTFIGCWVADGYGMFSVLEKSSGRWIGRVGPWQPLDWPGTEFGWGLLPDACGHGYATEAAAASMGWAVDTLGWTDLIHCIDPANVPSQRVAQRLGAVNRGPGKLPPPSHDVPIEIWGQTADAWRARVRS